MNSSQFAFDGDFAAAIAIDPIRWMVALVALPGVTAKDCQPHVDPSVDSITGVVKVGYYTNCITQFAVFVCKLLKINGGQGRIRTFVRRKGGQIYSLLALTTHPPVRRWPTWTRITYRPDLPALAKDGRITRWRALSVLVAGTAPYRIRAQPRRPPACLPRQLFHPPRRLQDRGR
jgi:hypothetical protein